MKRSKWSKIPLPLGLKHYDNPKAFIEFSNDMQDVCKNIEEYSLGKKHVDKKKFW